MLYHYYNLHIPDAHSTQQIFLHMIFITYVPFFMTEKKEFLQAREYLKTDVVESTQLYGSNEVRDGALDIRLNPNPPI